MIRLDQNTTEISMDFSPPPGPGFVASPGAEQRLLPTLTEYFPIALETTGKQRFFNLLSGKAGVVSTGDITSTFTLVAKLPLF